jgi:hypothetical protein
VDRRRAKSLVKIAVKSIIAVAVLAAVGGHVRKTWRELASHRETLHLDAGSLALAVPFYLTGLGLFGGFYARILRFSPTPMPVLPALRAYYISHLGKYVPGKALVVVLRAGLSAPFGARPATAAFATVYETVVMMASGGLIAAIGFATPPVQGLALGAGLGLGLTFLILVEPRIFPRLSKLLSIPFRGVGSDAFPHYSHRLLGEGLLWSSCGWIFLGLSQVAVIAAVMGRLPALEVWPAIIGGVALATVAGFAVAVLPAGLGVREWVLMVALKPAIGESLAVVSTLVLRLVWVVGEATAAAALGFLRPRLVPTNVP